MHRLAILIAVPFAVAATGGAAAAGPVAHASTGSVVSTAHTRLGTILVGPHGRTLYLFEKDTGTTSHCSGQCAAAWPPLTTTGNPRAAGAAQASKLGTTTRGGGVRQVTYDGHPLYYFAGDTHAGTTTGQGLDSFGAPWYVLAPSGAQVTGS